MLSALVLAPRPNAADAAEARVADSVVRSLGVLVGAAVADLVRDACIVGPPGERLEKIADHAGCSLVEDVDPRRALQSALTAMRCDHVLLLQAGYGPAFGFIDEMTDWMRQAQPPAAALRLEPEGLAQRLFPELAPVAGLVARKKEFLAVQADDPAAFARALHAKTLRTRARRLV
jgi:hypothetical protein